MAYPQACGLSNVIFFFELPKQFEVHKGTLKRNISANKPGTYLEAGKESLDEL
jgi:hypothetical protein